MPIRNIPHINASDMSKNYIAYFTDGSLTNFAVDALLSNKTYTWSNSNSYDVFIHLIRFWLGSKDIITDAGFFLKESALANGIKLSFSTDGTTETEYYNFKETKDFYMLAGWKNIDEKSTCIHTLPVDLYVPETLFRRHSDGLSDTYLKLTIRDDLERKALEFGYACVIGAKG